MHEGTLDEVQMPQGNGVKGPGKQGGARAHGRRVGAEGNFDAGSRPPNGRLVVFKNTKTAETVG